MNNHQVLCSPPPSSSTPWPFASSSFTDFSFETIPYGLTPTDGDGDVSQDIYALSKSIRKNFLQPFRELLARLHDRGHLVLSLQLLA